MPEEIEKERHRDHPGQNTPHSPQIVNQPRWNQGTTARVPSLQEARHALFGKHDTGHEPADAHQPIQSSRDCRSRSDFGIVDANKAVHLHQPVPQSPQQQDRQHPIQVFVCQRDADQQQKKWCQDESRPESAKEIAIAVSPNHARQVMSTRSNCGDQRRQQIVRQADTVGLEQRHNRNDERRSGHKKHEIGPRTEYPRIWRAWGLG